MAVTKSPNKPKRGVSGPKKDKILVLSVDRDDDMGRKTGLKGPITGAEKVMESGIRLGMSDPEDSDFNAIFQALRLSKEMKKQYVTEVAILTGHKNVGVESDMRIGKQLDKVLKDFRADYVLLVSDGSQDEHVLPLIQSRVPVLSIDRVIVKQSERLESGYYKIREFLEETLEKPKVARLLFGLPAIFLLLYAVLGLEGWRIILGAVGAFLFIKGFKLDKYLFGAIDEFRTSMTRRRFAFFTYIVSIAVTVLATYWGYEAAATWANIGLFEAASSFVAASVYLYFIAAAIAWIGKSVSKEKRTVKGIVAVLMFGFAVSLVVNNAARLIVEPELSMLTFVLSIAVGFGLIFVALVMEIKK